MSLTSRARGTESRVRLRSRPQRVAYSAEHFLRDPGFLLIPTKRRTWGPRGQTPVIKYSYRHDRISALAALSVSARRRSMGLYVRFQQANFTAMLQSNKDNQAALNRQLKIALGVFGAIALLIGALAKWMV